MTILLLINTTYYKKKNSQLEKILFIFEMNEIKTVFAIISKTSVRGILLNLPLDFLIPGQVQIPSCCKAPAIHL